MFEEGGDVGGMATEAHRRYAEILKDVEGMIDDHINHQNDKHKLPSKLKLLVPSAGPFFTTLPLEAAFKYQDSKRYISSRRFVAPSFNDVRLVLNSAQVMAVTRNHELQLATFDGDVTLYDDGMSLEPSSPIIPRLIDLMRRGIMIGIVTAAGYTTPDLYHARLHGLLDAIATSPLLTSAQRHNLIIMGGEANYLFEFSPSAPHLLLPVDRSAWLTSEMASWSDEAIHSLLDVAESALRECIRTLALPAIIVRKDRAVGIIPRDPAFRLPRETLEETVLVVQKTLDVNAMRNPVHARIPFCAFNGGRDVFVDIGDKSWGVTVCQNYFGRKRATAAGAPHPSNEPDFDASSSHSPFIIKGENTLHVGDQFLSAGSNDFKARSVCTTAWIASPSETLDLLEEVSEALDKTASAPLA